MTKSRVIFRVDGDNSIGFGHIMRCIALAEMLRDSCHISFVIRESTKDFAGQVNTVADEIIQLPVLSGYAEEAIYFSGIVQKEDIVVLDGYHFDTSYQLKLRENASRIVSIDDVAQFHYASDVVINHAPGVAASAFSKDPYTQLCLGINYLLLRNPFLEAAQKTRKINRYDTALISMGGADVHNLTSKFLKLLCRSEKIKKINIIIGKSFRHENALNEILDADKTKEIHLQKDISASEMVKSIAESHIAVCPCSTSVFEMMAVGIGIISGSTADNQSNIARFVHDSGAANYVGELNTVSEKDILELVEGMNVEVINEHIARQKELIDGSSAKFLKEAILQ